RLGQAPVDQDEQAGQAHHSQDRSHHHRQYLLESRAQAQRVVDGRRGQQAEQVREEQRDDADVEQVAAPAQRAALEHLAGIALPRVLFALEARQAAEQEHRQGDVGIHAEEEVMDMSGHAVLLTVARARPAPAWGRYRRNAPAAPPGRRDAAPARCRWRRDRMSPWFLPARPPAARAAAAAPCPSGRAVPRTPPHKGCRPRPACRRCGPARGSRRPAARPPPAAGSGPGTPGTAARSRAVRWCPAPARGAGIPRAGPPWPGRGRATRRGCARTGAGNGPAAGRTWRRIAPAARSGRPRFPAGRRPAPVRRGAPAPARRAARAAPPAARRPDTPAAPTGRRRREWRASSWPRYPATLSRWTSMNTTCWASPRGLLPNRLPCDTPPEQPLPNEKPQPPRMSKASSAYSRCEVGMTKRSS